MFKLPDLPYSYDALHPYMSAETLEFHHDKHHQAYVTFVNNYVKDHPQFANLSLEEIIIKASKDAELAPLFNNAAQIFNHNEFWPTMHKSSKSKFPGELEKQIKQDFGSVDEFKQAFEQAAVSLFGAGWAWLTFDHGRLIIKKYQNGGNPLADRLPAIMGCDVWEHSYYIDYRNKRADYVKAFLNHLVNWEYVNECFVTRVK